MKSNTALSLGLAFAISLGTILPAAAATTAAKPSSTSAPKMTHYYVSLKSKGTGCEVVEAKPSTKMMVGKHSYKTESDAQAALREAKACKA